MKQSRRKQKSEHSIAGTLFRGLFVLTVCLGICFAHMSDIRQMFQEVKNEENYKNVQSAENIVFDHINTTLNLIEQAAVLMTADKKKLNNADIFETIQQYGALENFTHVYYLSNEGKLYRQDETVSERTTEDMGQILPLRTAACFAKFEQEDARKSGVAYYVAPVYLEQMKVGHLVGAADMSVFFSGYALEHISEQADVFLMDKDGNVYAQTTDAHIAEGDNLLAYLKEESADTYSVRRVLDIRKLLNKQQYQKTYIVGKDGMTDYIEVMQMPGMNRIDEFVKKYPEPGVKAAAEWLKTVIAWRRRFDIEIDF